MHEDVSPGTGLPGATPPDSIRYLGPGRWNAGPPIRPTGPTAMHVPRGTSTRRRALWGHLAHEGVPRGTRPPEGWPAPPLNPLHRSVVATRGLAEAPMRVPRGTRLPRVDALHSIPCVEVWRPPSSGQSSVRGHRRDLFHVKHGCRRHAPWARRPKGRSTWNTGPSGVRHPTRSIQCTRAFQARSRGHHSGPEDSWHCVFHVERALRLGGRHHAISCTRESWRREEAPMRLPGATCAPVQAPRKTAPSGGRSTWNTSFG